MKHFERQPGWRPKTDISHRFTFNAYEQPFEEPKTREAAVAFIAGLNLTEVVVDYAGSPDVQADLLVTLAAQHFPKLFRELVMLEPSEPRSVA